MPIPPDVAQELLAVLNGNSICVFWTGNGEERTAVSHRQEDFRTLLGTRRSRGTDRSLHYLAGNWRTVSGLSSRGHTLEFSIVRIATSGAYWDIQGYVAAKRRAPELLGEEGNALAGALLLSRAHITSNGRALAPDSPPTMTQYVPVRSRSPRSSRRGSHDRNRTRAGTDR